VLVILPLIVNQANDYVQGLEKLKTLKTRKYRRGMESDYNSLLEQHSILKNGLKLCLQGLEVGKGCLRVDQHDRCRKSHHSDEAPQDRGNHYDSHVRTLTELAKLIEEFAKNLEFKLLICPRLVLIQVWYRNYYLDFAWCLLPIWWPHQQFLAHGIDKRSKRRGLW
jgi:hypothetical protein